MPDKAQSIRIAYIGGGSRYWASMLMSDLAACPHLTGELILHDIDREAAEHNVKVGQAVFDHPDAATRFEVIAEPDLEKALQGATFVVSSIEPGPIDARYADLEIPLQHGIYQSVGDTTGPGGILRSMRAVPTHLQFSEAIAAHCPDAWVINYTNPMTLCTRALGTAAPALKVLGCCHEVFGTQSRLGKLVQEWFGLDQRPARHDVKLDIAGVNHFTVATAASWDGHDLMPRLREMIEQPGFFESKAADAQRRKDEQQYFGSAGLILYDILRNLDVLGAAGDRHLAEFLPWYLTDEQTLHRWGVTLTPYQWRKSNAEQPRVDPAQIAGQPLKPSGEEGLQILLALLGIEPLDSNVNMVNRGQMPGYPEDAVVETYAQFRRDAVRPLVAGPLPPLIDSHMRRIVTCHEVLLQACIDRDLDQAFSVMLMDPLVTLPVDDARAMFDAMVEHNRPWLEGWS
jgi:alpha-galactosidase